jgi:hypothetical protein
MITCDVYCRHVRYTRCIGVGIADVQRWTVDRCDIKTVASTINSSQWLLNVCQVLMENSFGAPSTLFHVINLVKYTQWIWSFMCSAALAYCTIIGILSLSSIIVIHHPISLSPPPPPHPNVSKLCDMWCEVKKGHTIKQNTAVKPHTV